MTSYFDPESAREIASDYLAVESRPDHTYRLNDELVTVKGEQPIGELVAQAFRENLDQPGNGPASFDPDVIVGVGQLLAAATRQWADVNGHAPEWALKKAQEQAVTILATALQEGMGGYYG